MLFLELNTRNVRENLGKVWEGEFTSNPALLNTTWLIVETDVIKVLHIKTMTISAVFFSILHK
jgi:hypothetical protein